MTFKNAHSIYQHPSDPTHGDVAK